MLTIAELKDNDSRVEDEKQVLTFRKFLELMELKNRQKRLQHSKQIKLRKKMRLNILERVKILPPHMVEGVIRYNTEYYNEETSRKLSENDPMRRMHSEEFPRKNFRINHGLQKMPNWRLSLRKDELNSMRFSTVNRNRSQCSEELEDTNIAPRHIRLSLPVKVSPKAHIKALFQDRQTPKHTARPRYLY